MNLTEFKPEKDIWETLSSGNRKNVMYGMGNGADKILAVCEKYGIEIHDFFASDGFVRGHSFHGKRVLSYSEIKEKYKNDEINVLLSFASSLPDVINNFKRISGEFDFYAPDVPVCGSTLFTLAFARAHEAELKEVYGMLADGESRRIFENVIYYKLTGKIEYLFNAESDRDKTFSELLDAKSITSYADLGAYNGDTVRELIRYAPNLSYVAALEPDRRSYRKLSEYRDTVEYPKIECVNAAAWCDDAVLTFGDEGNRNSGIFAKGKSVDVAATSLDKLLCGRKTDYIKYDVEGCECEALEGSRNTIISHKPKLLVSVYHRSEDIFAIPLQIKKINPDYKFYLRRFPYVPAWDLNLICI